MVGVPASAQHPDRVHPGNGAAGAHQRRKQHVDHLCRGGRGQEGRKRLRADDPPVDLPHSARDVHPRVRGDDEQGRQGARDGDRDHRQPVSPGGQALPPVEVQADEDRLDEEREALEGERQAERSAVAGHERRPQQAELEGEDRSRHRADREHHGEGPCPLAGEGEPDRVARPDPATFGVEQQPGHAHPEDREADVEGQ